MDRYGRKNADGLSLSPLGRRRVLDETIDHFMNRRVLAGGPDTPLSEVVRRMDADAQSAFVVCDRGTPIGVITERDVVTLMARSLAGASQAGTLAGDIMASPVHTLRESACMGEVVRVMKERGFRRVPIVDERGHLTGIVNIGELQAATNAALERRGRDLEAAVEQRTAELRAANDRLTELTLLDGLTGLLNRRALESRLDENHAAAIRYGHKYAVILLDIDHFKLYNDGCGHLAGDEVIRTIGAVLRESVRRTDSVYRYGGEEFLVLLPETDAAGAELTAERIRGAVALRAMPHPSSPTDRHVTVSMGYTDVLGQGIAERLDWREVVRRADSALYAAKQAGRNRALVWRDDRTN